MNEQPLNNIKPEHCAESEVNLLHLVRVIVRRRMVMVKFCVVAVLLSIGLSLTMKNMYTAASTILPPPREFGVGGGGAALSRPAVQACWVPLRWPIWSLV